MTIQLPTDLQQFVVQQISLGAYRTEVELVADAVRRLRDDTLRYQSLREEIQEAAARLDRGEGIFIDGDEALGRFFDEIEVEVEQELASKNPSRP